MADDVKISFSADTDDLTDAIDEARKSIESLGKAVQDAGSNNAFSGTVDSIKELGTAAEDAYSKILKIGEAGKSAASSLQSALSAVDTSKLGNIISSAGGAPTGQVADYIRQAAQARGIDPNTALRVAQSEGLNSYVGDQGTSFGPFQLHYGGSGIPGMNASGLGDVFTRQTGFDARNASTWRQQVDFSLDQAAKGGWGPWHGAARVGIGQWQGISDRTPTGSIKSSSSSNKDDDDESKKEQKQAADDENRRYEIAKDGLKKRQELLRTESQGDDNKSGQYEQEKQIEQERLQLEQQHWTKLKAIWGQGTEQYKKADTELVKADQDAATKRKQIDAQAMQEQVQSYESSYQEIGSIVSSSLMGMIGSHERFRDAAKRMVMGLANYFVQQAVQMAAHWLAQQTAMTVATTTAQATQTAAVTAGVTAQTAAKTAGDTAQIGGTLASILKSITASAGESFAGVFGFLSPIMGPAAAGPAAAAEATVLGIGSSLASFASGAWELPADMIAQVHAGEMIVPAAPAAAMRDMLASGSAKTNNVTVNHATHFNVSAMDSQGVKQFFKNNSKTIMRTINEGVRTGAHLGLSKAGV